MTQDAGLHLTTNTFSRLVDVPGPDGLLDDALLQARSLAPRGLFHQVLYAGAEMRVPDKNWGSS